MKNSKKMLKVIVSSNVKIAHKIKNISFVLTESSFTIKAS